MVSFVFLALVLLVAHSAVAINLGGFDNGGGTTSATKSASSKVSQIVATSKETTDSATNSATGTTTPTTASGLLIDSSVATTTTNTHAKGSSTATYNQWGFTGSQSVWTDATLAASSATASSSSSSKSSSLSHLLSSSQADAAGWKILLAMVPLMAAGAVLELF